MATTRRWLYASILIMGFGLAGRGAIAQSFTDVTAWAGVDYLQFEIPVPFVTNGIEYMNGGAAVGDYDNDGFPDLYVTRSHDTDILFRNNGDGSFTDVTAAAGLTAINANTNGAAFADIDNDGDQDLYVTGQCGIPCSLPSDSRHYLFINDGIGNFTEEAILRGADIGDTGPHYGFSVAFGDYDLDGYLDIHVNEWRRDSFNPLMHISNARLLHNLGAAAPGYFEDVTVSAGVVMDDVPLLFGVQGTTTFTSTFSDMDGDGWPDLLIAADFGTSRLFWNNGDSTFTDGTLAAGVGGDENGMGSAVGDYDGDGMLDWFVTSIYDPLDLCQCDNGLSGNRLYRNLGGRTFSDETDSAGVRDGGWGWGAIFLDYDNDGDLDLTMNNGADWPDPMVPGADHFMNDPVRLWRNDAAIMTEVAVSEGISLSGSGKSVLRFDYDLDGDQDLFYVTNAGYPALYRNDIGNLNDWLRVEALGVGSNRDGVGARIEILASSTELPQMREIRSGSNFLGQSERVAHFGLGSGAGETVGVKVTWPRTGRTVIYDNVPRNSELLVVEPDDPLSVVTLTTDTPPPVQFGSVGDVTFTATAESSGGVEYRFFVRDPNDTLFLLQDYGSNNILNAGSPSAAGTWYVIVQARNAGSEAEFEAGDWMEYEVTPAPIASVNLTADKPPPVQLDTVGEVIFTATPVGATGSVEYQFYVRDPAGNLFLLQDYSSSNTFNAGEPSSAGIWNVLVRARLQGSEAEFEAEKWIEYEVTEPSLTAVSLSADKPPPVQFTTVGEVLFTATPVGASSGIRYRFHVRDPAGTWYRLQDYSSSNTFNAGEPSSAGTWVVLVHALHPSSGADFDVEASMIYEVLP